MYLIALLTYTSLDEANAQLTMRDFFGALRGDDLVRIKYETTYNWLGILGAVMAHWSFNSFMGLSSLTLPFLMLGWAIDLFRYQRITPLFTRRSSTILLAALFISGLLGTLNNVSWLPDLPREWPGALGQYIADIVSQLMGTTGAFLIYLAALAVTLIVGLELSTNRISVTISLALSRVKDFTSNKLRRQSSHAADSTPHDGSAEEHEREEKQPALLSSIASHAKPDPDIEPAEMIRRKERRPPEDSPVRIVRPTVRHAEEAASTTSAEDVPSAAKQVDINEVEQRLASLHPNRDIKLRPNRKGGRNDDRTAPLFEDESAERPNEAGITITVEDNPSPETEVDITSRAQYDENIRYLPPGIDLLQQSDETPGITDEELETNARLLTEKLATFRINIENLSVTPGPVVTQYEFVPAAGIKVSQIESLADDIALALKAPGVRIIAPIPGRGTVGIEIPNHNPAVVRFSSIIKSPKYHNPDIRLPVAMGKTVSGEVYCADLAKMPHLLIAGATGKGKSVGINTIIASLLYRLHPRDLKFVIIDPKRVEMTLYKSLRRHFLAVSPDVAEEIITEPMNAVAVLKSVVEEMQQRYTILAAAGQRNIADYNRKTKDGTLQQSADYQHHPMPYIIVVIDELADLMLTASKEVEEPIVRLAQLARAVGIHCIVATQRPSVDVVTGLIKANFPARIAYQVASRIDSRTILDASGAEHLIGNGDLLFLPGNTPKPIRMQNAFISTEEVEALCSHIGNQNGYSTPYMLPSAVQKKNSAGTADGDRDPLFQDAARIFIQLQQASVSTLQRRLKVGYARAARIVDELEMAGIVGPQDGSRGRQVLLQSEAELEAYL